jgi:hypothetical protein
VPKRGQPPDAAPEFFLDRSLGRVFVTDALRGHGCVVHPMFEVYPTTEQELEDHIWIPDVTARGWPILMKDDAIRRKPQEQEALLACGARAFVVTNANLNGRDLAHRFVENRHRIIQRCRKPGPFIVGVYANGLEKLYPKP